MTRFTIFNITSLCSILLLNACASSNEGFVDYRKAELHKTQPVLACLPSNTPADKPADCKISSQKGQLLRQNSPVDDNALIKEGDNLSLHLCSAYIHDFHETDFSQSANGEIAIVANVFEMNGSADFDHSDNELKQGRLVFYSSDVEKKQKLNFHNMPIYGPKTYDGAPLGIQLGIFELDSTPPELKSVLDYAAHAGAKAYPPASPVLKILNGLGKSFLNGDKNDTEFKYSMVLSPTGGYLNQLHPVIEAGYYVFIREEVRDLTEASTAKWQNLKLNSDTCTLETLNGIPYADNTYLVISLNKGESALNIDLAQNTYGNFLKKLAEARNEKFSDLETELKGALSERIQTQNFARAKDLLAVIKGEKKGVPTFAMKDLLALITDHKANDSSAAVEEQKFTLEQMRYIQSELLQFAQDKGKMVNPDDFALDKITRSATKSLLLNAIKPQANSSAAQPATPIADPKPAVSAPTPLPEATN